MSARHTGARSGGGRSLAIGRRISANSILGTATPRLPKPPEHELPQQPGQSTATVPAGAGVSECGACDHAQAKGVVEFTIGQQARIGGEGRAAKLEHQSAVEIESENAIGWFTRWVLHDGPAQSGLTY